MLLGIYSSLWLGHLVYMYIQYPSTCTVHVCRKSTHTHPPQLSNFQLLGSSCNYYLRTQGTVRSFYLQ